MIDFNSKYHLLKSLVTQSYAFQAFALFYFVIKQRELITFNMNNFKTVSFIIAQLKSAEYLQLMKNVRLQIFTLNVWKDLNSNKKKTSDLEFQTMCHFLKEIELFLTIWYVIKYENIELLKYCISSLIIFFLSTQQHNYIYKILYYIWILRFSVFKELHHSIIIVKLVNCLNKLDCFKIINLSMKHFNSKCKMKMKCYKNLIKNTHLIFNKVYLSNT